MTSIYEWIHGTLGMCFWTLPTIILLIACVIMFITHAVKQKKRNKQEEQEGEKI